MITTVTNWRTYEDSEDDEGNYTGGTRSRIIIAVHDSVGALYEYVRRVVEFAADMGDGSSASLICAFWTYTGAPLSIETLTHEAYEREEVTQ